MRESIDDYVKGCNQDQLKTLIDKAQKRQKYLASAGKVLLFGVFSSKDSAKWFTSPGEAKTAFVEAAKNDIEERYPEVSIERRSVFVEELPEYLGEKRARQYLEGKPALVDKDKSNPWGGLR